ncbi:hypothetical protein AURDEDRAFT_131520, partial [Auricularia subglabra TFB-10046 SS5]
MAAQIAKEGSPIILVEGVETGGFLGQSDSDDDMQPPAEDSEGALPPASPGSRASPQEAASGGKRASKGRSPEPNNSKIVNDEDNSVRRVSTSQQADVNVTEDAPAGPGAGASPPAPPEHGEVVSESDETERERRRKAKGKGRASAADMDAWLDDDREAPPPDQPNPPPAPPSPAVDPRDVLWDDDEVPDLDSLRGSDGEDGEYNNPEPIPTPGTWPFPRRGEVVDAFRAVMEAFQDVGTERKASAQPENGQLNGRPSTRRTNAMAMLERFTQMLSYHAAGVLGQRVETVQKFQSEAFQPRVQSRWAMFVSFLKNDSDYQPRRDFDQLLGRKKSYTREERKKMWLAFQKERTDEEIDFLLFNHLLAFPYGPEGGTPADRAELVNDKAGQMRKYSNFLAAVHNIDTVIIMGGARPDHDWHPAFTRLIASYNARDFVFNKFGMSEQQATGAFQAEVFNSVHNLQADKRLIAQGRPLPVRIESAGNDSFAYGPRPVAYAAGALGRSAQRLPTGPLREFAAAGTSRRPSAAVTGANVPRRKKATAVNDGDESDVNLASATAAELKEAGGVTIPPGHIVISGLEHGSKTKVIHFTVPLAVGPVNEIDYQVNFTAAEKAYAVKLWRERCANAGLSLRAASSEGLPIGDTYHALIKQGMTMVRHPNTVFFRGESISKKTFDGSGNRMQRDMIFAILNDQLDFVKDLRLDAAAMEAVRRMTGNATAEYLPLVVSSPIRKVTNSSGKYSTPDCFVGSCRMFVYDVADPKTRIAIGMPRLLLHHQAMPFMPIIPADYPANAARKAALKYANEPQPEAVQESNGEGPSTKKHKTRKPAKARSRKPPAPKKKKAAPKKKKGKKQRDEEEEEEEEEAVFSSQGASAGEGASAPPVSRRVTRQSAAEADIGDTDNEDNLAPIKLVGSQKEK